MMMNRPAVSAASSAIQDVSATGTAAAGLSLQQHMQHAAGAATNGSLLHGPHNQNHQQQQQQRTCRDSDSSNGLVHEVQQQSRHAAQALTLIDGAGAEGAPAAAAAARTSIADAGTLLQHQQRPHPSNQHNGYERQQQQQFAATGSRLFHNSTSNSNTGRGDVAVASMLPHAAQEAPVLMDGSLNAAGGGGAVGVVNLAQGVQTQAQEDCLN
jgi:hypothetical protein